jgi:hypothetical protein
VIRNNNLYECVHGLHNITAHALDARYNYWGKAATDSMEAGGNPKNIAEIYDYYDNHGLGLVNYSNWLTGEVPVELASFTAQEQDGAVVLNWATQTEQDNLGWNVLRSALANGPFVQVNGRLVPGAGTSAMPHVYSYTDATAVTGTYYYQLEQIDRGGSITYSPVISATMEPLGMQHVFQPATDCLCLPFSNPVRDLYSIVRKIQAADVNVMVYDMFGQAVNTIGTHLPGIYFIKIDSPTTSRTVKVLLVK